MISVYICSFYSTDRCFLKIISFCRGVQRVLLAGWAGGGGGAAGAVGAVGVLAGGGAGARPRAARSRGHPSSCPSYE